jgi:RNA polymerase-binding transcription factor DksA
MAKLTTQQSHEIKSRLTAKRRQLLAEAKEELLRWGQHPIGELAGEVADVGDESVATAMTDLDHAIVERHVDEIRDIDGALARMRAHRYGRCIDCDDDIEPARLLAFPTAKRCVDCQNVREHTYAHRLTPTL